VTLHETVDQFIGLSLTDVLDIILRDRGGDAMLVAVCFCFESDYLIFYSNPDDDTISAAKVPNITEWVSARPGAGELSIQKNADASQVFGRCMCNFWECYGQPEYVDAVDLGIGDLNYPTMKLLCSGSELHIFTIARGCK
jgi:Family of unknown function (DUF6334)